MTHHIDLDSVVLSSGAHSDRDDGTCLLEAAAWWAGEPHSDQPGCVSPVLAGFGRSWSDGMRSDEERASLRQYIPLLVGTAGDRDADERRAWMAADWLVRICAPTWLRRAGLADLAERLASLQPMTSTQYANSVMDEIIAASGVATDAGRTAMSGANRMYNDDAWAALEATAIVAAEEAAWECAVGAGIGSAAADYAATSARGAINVLTARGVTLGDLEPTIQELQRSAHDLLARMIAG